MRYQGKVKVWKDDKGFGFVEPNGGGTDVFLHISAFPKRHKRPQVGDLITFELSVAESARPKAANVQFVEDRRVANTAGTLPILATVSGLLILGLVGYVAYVRISNPNSTIPASLYKIFIDRSALHNEGRFQCNPPKISCAQMTSCSEAFFHQERCGAAEMDGDRDGIPCEQQWCK